MNQTCRQACANASKGNKRAQRGRSASCRKRGGKFAEDYITSLGRRRLSGFGQAGVDHITAWARLVRWAASQQRWGFMRESATPSSHKKCAGMGSGVIHEREPRRCRVSGMAQSWLPEMPSDGPLCRAPEGDHGIACFLRLHFFGLHHRIDEISNARSHFVIQLVVS